MKGKQRWSSSPRDRIGLRLGRRDRDRYLADQVERARQDDINVSDLIKELLYAYFTGELDAFNTPGNPAATQAINERVSKLVALKVVELEK